MTLLNHSVFIALTLCSPLDTLLQIMHNVSTIEGEMKSTNLGFAENLCCLNKPCGLQRFFAPEAQTSCFSAASCLPGLTCTWPIPLDIISISIFPNSQIGISPNDAWNNTCWHSPSFSDRPESVVLSFGSTLESAGEIFKQLMPGCHPQRLLLNWLSCSLGIGMLMCRVQVENHWPKFYKKLINLINEHY